MLNKKKYIPQIIDYYSDGYWHAVKVKVGTISMYYFLDKDNRPCKDIEADIKEAFELIWENNNWTDVFTMDIHISRKIAELCGWKFRRFLPN